MSDVLTPAISPTPALPRSPYKGLMPYAEEDASFFFGRERDQERIAGNLRASRLTLLYGPSGVGKSSVLQAGVAYQLKAQALQTRLEEGEPEFAVVVFNRWQDDPVRGLIAQTREAVAEALGVPLPEIPLAELVSLPDALQNLGKALGGELLIILDQFEEYFLYHPQEDSSGSFAVEFPRAVNRIGLGASFLISIREDALAKLDRFKGRIEGLFDNYLRLDYLDQEAARAAIEKPLAEYNRRLEPATASDTPPVSFSIEPSLVEAILTQVKTGQVQLGESGQGMVTKAKTGPGEENRIETPYLQLVMLRLWEEEVGANSSLLRLATLQKLGGAEQIVKTHLDATMQNLSEKEQAAAASVFRYLVTPSGSKIALSLSDLTGYSKLTDPAARAELTGVLNRLCGGEVRILRPLTAASGQAGEVRYEIFHDVLAKAVLDWQTRYTTEQEREATLVASRKRTRLFLTVGSILFLIILLVAGLAVFAFIQLGEANQQRKLALSRQLAVQSRLLFDTNFPLATQLALAGYRVSPSLEARDSLNDGLLAHPEFTAFLHSSYVNSVAFSLDGKILASGSADASIILWDVASHNQVATLKGHSSYVRSVTFSPDGKILASGSFDGSIILWDVASHNQLAVLKGHSSSVNSVAFSPDGKTLASSSADNGIILWDVASHNQLAVFKGHSSSVNSVAFSPDGKTLASGSGNNIGNADKSIILWDVASHNQLAVLKGHSSSVNSVAFSPDGKTLASSSADNGIILWDIASHNQVATLKGHSSSVNSVAFSPDGKTLASSSADKSIILWDVASRNQLSTLKGHSSSVWSVAFSPDGKTLASGSDDANIILWDVVSRNQLGTLKGHSSSIWSVAFSPDGKTLASSSADNSIILWDVASHNQVATLKGHSSSVNSVVFSPDGKTLASGSGNNIGSADNSIILWDVANHNQLAVFKGHSFSVWSVAFSPDGKTLASGSDDASIILWDVASHNQVATFKGHSSSVNSVAFSLDDKILASGSDDKSIILWNAKADTRPEQACQIVNQNLRQDEWKQYLGDEPYQKICPGLP
jgi:uncharacterized delta-60 repeat protein